MRAWTRSFARTPINRKRVLRKSAGFATPEAKARYYGWLRRMRATLVLSKQEQK